MKKFVCNMALCVVHVSIYPMHLKTIRPFFNDKRTIQTIKHTLDTIEQNKLDYEDYSKRRGLIWSDVPVNTSQPIRVIAEYNSQKISEVDGIPTLQSPQSLLCYHALKSIVCSQMLPKMFEAVSEWTQLPERVGAQVFFQRCSSSDAMDWHQDPGEQYDPQANYSMIVWLSKQDHPEYGWNGGLFNIRPGLPTDPLQKPACPMVPQYNQAVIFDNQANNHAVSAISPTHIKAIRDLVVITLYKEIPDFFLQK